MISHRDMMVVVPVHLGSKRLPYKPLRLCAGRTIAAHAMREAVRYFSLTSSVCRPHFVMLLDGEFTTAQRAIVESDLRHIDSSVSVVQMPGRFRNGTERVAAFVKSERLEWLDRVVIWQSDVVRAEPGNIYYDLPDMGTLLAHNSSIMIGNASGIVRAKINKANNSIQFSRDYLKESYIHCGVYIYSPEKLVQYAELRAGQREVAESLEQLRWPDNGVNWPATGAIIINSVHHINTIEDLHAFRAVKEL